MGDSDQAPFGDATLLLSRLREGDLDAAEYLLPLVYGELRARAGACFRGQPADHTLQPTALVHEAYLKMIRAPDADWNGRSHFCAVASKAMRQILIDHARRRACADRAHEHRREGATLVSTPSGLDAVDVLALDDALVKLASLSDRQVRLVELRFFGGLGNPEIAELLDVSTSTVEKEWRKVRAWLALELSGGAAGTPPEG